MRINCQEWPLKVTFSPEMVQSFHTRPRVDLSKKGPRIIERQRSLSSTHSSENRG